MLRRLAVGAGATAAGGVAVAGGQAYYVRNNFRLPPDAAGPNTGVAGLRPEQRTAPVRKNLVFFGDSLVTGVGCSSQDGPVMPRRTADLLAQAWGVEVCWTALGETGADVKELRGRLFPSLEKEVARCGQAGERLDAVVIICGLNDIKSCFLHAQPSKHPGSYRRDLHELVAGIKELAGEQCLVLLPAVPLECTPRFTSHWPLSSFIKGAAALWEGQKRSLVQQLSSEEHVAFVPAPESIPGEAFCEDGMHPNDSGYALLAEHLARSLVLNLAFTRT